MKSTPVFIAAIFTLSATLAHDHSEPKDDVQPQTRVQPAKIAAETSQLTLRLVDEATGEPIPGCVRLRETGAGEWLTLDGLLPRMLGLPQQKRALGWHVATGRETISTPKTRLTIEGISGIEYRAATREIDLTNQTATTVDLPLRRIFDSAAKGWVAGNTHLHLRKLTRETADRYLTEVSRADGLRVVFVSYLERALVDREYTTNAYTAADLRRISGDGLIFAPGEEYRHNFGAGGEGYGHVMFLAIANRILPASVGPGITHRGTDGTPLRAGIDAARADGGTIVWCHNAFGLEDLPNWLSGRIHAQNIFDGGNRGSYTDSFYRYLNLGLRVPFSTGTDWFVYDFSRVYVRHAEDAPLSAETWLSALRQGRSLITNGPWIELNVDESEPGDTIDLAQPREVSISAKAAGGVEFEGLEIVQNGEIITTSADSGFSAEIREHRLKISEPAWIAARVRPKKGAKNAFGAEIFAHTSPVYVNFQGRAVFDAKTAETMRSELKMSLAAIERQAKFADETERETVLAIYREALESIPRR